MVPASPAQLSTSVRRDKEVAGTWKPGSLGTDPDFGSPAAAVLGPDRGEQAGHVSLSLSLSLASPWACLTLLASDHSQHPGERSKGRPGRWWQPQHSPAQQSHLPPELLSGSVLGLTSQQLRVRPTFVWAPRNRGQGASPQRALWTGWGQECSARPHIGL